MFLNGRSDIAGALSFGVQKQDLIVDATGVCLAFANRPVFKGAIALARRINLQLTVFAVQIFP